jgi:hypothetical protein
VTEPDVHGRETAYLVYRFILENIAHQLGHPLFVGLRRGGVPAIQTVKLQLHGSIRQSLRMLLFLYLDTANIATTTFEKRVIPVADVLRANDHYQQHLDRSGTTHPKGIQSPRATFANKTKNAADVIGKDGRFKPSAIDEPRSLENVFVLVRNLLSTLGFIRGYFFGFPINLAFVDLKQFVGYVLKTTVRY